MKTLAVFFSLSLLAAFPTVSQGQTLDKVHDFCSVADPMDSMTVGPDGNLYGTTWGSSKPGKVFKFALDGTYTTLATITGGQGESLSPGLVLAGDGNFYGTAQQGGSYGYGTVFRVTPTGTVTVLHHFANSDGDYPWKLTLGSDGDLYGTTATGTNYNGTIFKITTGGTFTSLANIPSGFASFPSGLTEGPDGNFYGVTYNGGSETGRFYRVTPTGTITNLAPVQGQWSWYHTNLTLGSDGDFYGTAFSGGTYHRGSVFKATTAGVVTTLASFDGYNGFWPCGGLREGADGNFYGTTIYGIITVAGNPVNQDGTLFSVTPSGTITTLARFASLTNAGDDISDRIDGARPHSGVIFDSYGNLYGTTMCGGSNGGGTIFRYGSAPPEVEIVEEPASQSIDNGKTVTLKVVAKGKRALRYQWLKNGKVVGNSKTVAGAKTATLTLKNVGAKDSGTFSVAVSTVKGRKASQPAVLSVRFVDNDGDGVSDDLDLWPATAPGSIVNKQGASIAQLVPTTGSVTGGTWKTHGQYVAAVARVANAFRLAHLISAQDSSALVRTAAVSSIGTKPMVVAAANAVTAE